MKIIIGLILSVYSLFAISNLELAKSAEKVTSNFISSDAQMRMTLINSQGQQTLRELKNATLEGKDGDKSLLEFLTPADVKGTKMLTYEKIDKSDDQWMYLPALKRVKRIASNNKSGSFMGSEFSYEDIGGQDYRKFTYSGDAKEEGEFFVGQRVPKEENSGYTKEVTYIDKNTLLVKKIEYYDRKKEHLKTAIFSGYKKIKGVYRVGKIEMINHQNNKSTILEWVKDDIKVGLKKRDFNRRVLKQ
jgi:outer membrane lipoprotein-sorting protein